MSKKQEPVPYVEAAIYKGDMDKDGASLRINELRILMKTAAELNGLQYFEDANSFAIFGPKDKVWTGKEAAAEFKKTVLSRVDLCGLFGEAEVKYKVQRLVEIATQDEDRKLTCGLEIIKNRVDDMIMSANMSIREWLI